MYYFVIAIILFFCYKILTSRNNALGWYIMGICLIYNGFHIGPLYSRFLFTFLLFFRAILNNRFYGIVKKMPLRRESVIFIVGMAISAVMSSSYTISSKLMLAGRELLTTILIFPVAYFYLKIGTKPNLFVKHVIISLVVMFLAGMIELIVNHNYVHDIAILYFNDYALSSIEMGEALQAYDMMYGRSRIESLLCFSFDYGIYSLLLGLTVFYHYLKCRKLVFLLISVICGFFGGVMCGARSVLFPCLIFYLLSLRILYKGYKSVILYTTMAFFVGLYILLWDKASYYSFIITDLFTTGGAGLGGSSLDMRMNQLNVAVQLFYRSPIWGNGPKYLSTLSAGDVMRGAMMGSESYIFQLLIDNGAIGLVTSFFFFFSIFRRAIKERIRTKAYMIASLTGAFLLFSLLTGVQGAWFVFMPLLAYSFTTQKDLFADGHKSINCSSKL